MLEIMPDDNPLLRYKAIYLDGDEAELFFSYSLKYFFGDLKINIFTEYLNR